jgi:hypothetical protein
MSITYTKQTMRILIVTHHYPPLNKIASSRPYSWAKYWKQAGHEIYVLTTHKMEKDGPLDYTPPHNGVIAKEVLHWPYSALPDKNKRMACADAISSRQISKLKIVKFINVLSTIRIKLLPLKHIQKMWWIYPAIKHADRLYRSWKFNVVVSTYSPAACHIVASFIKKKTKAFWVADYRDLWTGNSMHSSSGIFFLFLKNFEKFFLKRADLVCTVSDPLRQKLQKLLNKPSIIIENGYDPEDYIHQRKPYFPGNKKIRIVYTGTVYPRKQDPTPLFSAINRLKVLCGTDAGKLSVLFYCPNSDYLDNLIEKFEIADTVSVCGFVDRCTSLQIQREADALLFLDWNDPSFKGVLTGKIFEYLYSNTPILSIGTEFHSSANDLIEESGTGFVLGRSVENIVNVLKKLIEGEELEYTPDNYCLERYHRGILAKKLLENFKDQSLDYTDQ